MDALCSSGGVKERCDDDDDDDDEDDECCDSTRSRATDLVSEQGAFNGNKRKKRLWPKGIIRKSIRKFDIPLPGHQSRH